jgi:branched-chain amino acid transport system substrate-binding protein
LAGVVYAAEPKGPIKIGLLLPMTGSLASNGEDVSKGFKLYLKQIDYQVSGRKIELVIADDKANPTEGHTKVRELVEREKVDILSGFVHSGVALALRDYIVSKKIPTVISAASIPALTLEKKSPYIFRVTVTAGMEALAGGWYAYSKLGIKKIIFIGFEFSFGFDNASAFKKFFTESGGKVVDEIYAPLGTADYGPFLTRILRKASEADSCVVVFAGADATRFTKQYAEYGLKKKLPIFCTNALVESTILPFEGDDAVGIKSFAYYVHTVDNPVNRSFAKAFMDEYKLPANQFSEPGYVSAKVIVEGIKVLGGDISDTSRLLEAIRHVQFNAPRGPFRFGKNQDAILPIYIVEIKKNPDGEIYPAIIDIIPNVDQNWRGARYEQGKWR